MPRKEFVSPAARANFVNNLCHNWDQSNWTNYFNSLFDDNKKCTGVSVNQNDITFTFQPNETPFDNKRIAKIEARLLELESRCRCSNEDGWYD